MSDYVYNMTLPWQSTSGGATITTASVTIYRMGCSVSLSIVTQPYDATPYGGQKQRIVIPNVPDFLQPTGDVNLNIIRLTQTDTGDTLSVNEQTVLTKSGVDVYIECEVSYVSGIQESIENININYINTVAVPTDTTVSVGPTGSTSSKGPVGQQLNGTYFIASRDITSNITIGTKAPGLTGQVVTFPTVRHSVSTSGTWALGTDTATITVPATGIYQYIYTITVVNSSGSTIRTVSTCMYVNGSLYVGGGATVKLPSGEVNSLVGQGVILLNMDDHIIVYIMASGTSTSITGLNSLITNDNTSALISLVKIN